MLFTTQTRSLTLKGLLNFVELVIVIFRILYVYIKLFGEIVMTDFFQRGILSELKDVPNVQYVFNDSSMFALTDFKVLKSHADNLIKCNKVTYNGKIKLIYNTQSIKSLRGALPSLDISSFMTVLANLLKSVLEIENNGFLNCDNLDISLDKVYVNPATMEVKLIYIPVLNSKKDVIAFENEFRTELVKLITCIPAFNCEKMMRICSYLSNGMMNLQQSYEQICNEISNNSKYSDLPKKVEQVPQPIMKQPVLHFYSLTNPNEVDFVIDTPEFIIGKNPSQVNGVVSFNVAISRVHCKISYADNRYYLTDLGSANGTYLNHYRLNAMQTCNINNGDIITLANSDFAVRF